jgi:hypothetical protein
MADEIIGFNRPDANELIRIIGVGGATGGTGFTPYDATKLTLAVATSGVPARSGTTLGKANVAVKHLVESSGDRVVTDSGFNMVAYNLASSAVATGAYILLLRLGDVSLVVWEECPA